MVFNTLKGARDAGTKVFMAVDGGSETSSSHMKNGPFIEKWIDGPGSARDCTDKQSATENCTNPDQVFGQLRLFTESKDFLITVATSRIFPDLLSYAHAAKDFSATKTAITGFHDAGLADAVRVRVRVRVNRMIHEQWKVAE